MTKTNNKLQFNAEGNIVKSVLPQDSKGKIATNVLSINAHKAHVRAITSKIHEIAPVVAGIVLRVKEDAVSKDLVLYGEQFMTKGSNNPNAMALMGYAGDFDKEGQPVIQLQHWDKEEKTLVPDYTVKCNEKINNTTYVFTNTHVVVEYGQLENDIKKIMKMAPDKTIAKKKQKLIDEIGNFGLIVNGTEISIGNTSTIGTKLTILNWSPSNMRNETQILSSLTEDESFEILNKVSGGVFAEALQGEVSIGDLIKISARLGILGAPAILLGQEANASYGTVVVLDEIEGTEDYDAVTKELLKANGLEIDNNTYDGAIVHGVQKVQQWFANMGRRMSEEKALLFALQTRSNKYFTKVFGEVKTQMNMQHRLNQLVNIYGESKVLYVEAGQDVSNLNKKDYKVIVVGNKDCLGTIMDYNGGKLLKNISLQTIVDGNIDTYLLDIAKCTDTATSGQMLGKLLTADKNGSIQALLECMNNDYKNKLDTMRTGDVDAHNASLAQFIFRYTEEGDLCQPALESIIKEELTRQKSLVYNAKINIKAWFQRALFDDSNFLTRGKVTLLAKNKTTRRLECYSRDIEVKFAEEIEVIESNDNLSRAEKDAATDVLLTGFAIKFPSPSSDENAIFTYLTADRIERRVSALYKANQISIEERDVLVDDFKNTSYGVTKIGADNTLKHKLAGMDTDYDGIAVVFEKELVDILIAKYPDNDGVACIIAG